MPWARVGAAWALVGRLGFCLAVTVVLLRRPGLLRGCSREKMAVDLALVVLLPGTSATVALSLALLGWPGNVLMAVALLIVNAALITGSTVARGRVWVLDGWRAHGPYRQVGFEIAPGHEEHRRPRMRRVPRPPTVFGQPPAATDDVVRRRR